MDLHRFLLAHPHFPRECAAAAILLTALFVIYAYFRINEYSIRISRLIEEDSEVRK